MRLFSSLSLASLLLLPTLALSQQPTSVTGTALYRERIALPAEAVFEATLEGVSRADAPSKTINSIRQQHPGNPPFPFVIPFEPGVIQDSHTYVVRARITLDGKLLFTSTERLQVLTQGHGSEIGTPIVMRMVRGPASGKALTPDASLTETYWKLVELNGKPITPAKQQREASLTLHAANHRITGSGGCNRLMGTYTLEGTALHLSGVASTMMACLHGMETEQQFTAALQKVERWKIAGATLWLYGSDEAPLARFMAVALN